MSKTTLYQTARRFTVLLLLVLIACRQTPDDVPTPLSPTATAIPATAVADEPTPAAEPTADGGVLISELLPGVPGDNNREFVELYNSGNTAVDLDGWSLWYRFNENQADQLLYQWGGRSHIPPFGHTLLLRAEQDVGITPDATFDLSLFERKGGVILYDAAGNVVDALGWGSDAPAAAFMGDPAPIPSDGHSLERLPGGELGNGRNSHNNAADMVAATPNPQNSGSPLTPLPAERLALSLTAPQLLPPGEQFEYVVEVTNLSEQATAVQVTVPIADHFTLIAAPDGAVLADGWLTWQTAVLEPNASASATVTLESPYTYIDTIVTGANATAAGLLPAYSAPQLVVMGGGAVPIAVARQLIGSQVTVEGVATMYTGGFFSGSTSQKFYIEDETGGIQIFAPGGQGIFDIEIGDVVRVTGTTEYYRDSLELIPGDASSDVEIIGTAEPPPPLPVTAADIETNDAVLGRLAILEGTAVRIDEFNFSYEIALQDAAGDVTLVLIEKDTGVTAEPLELGSQYRFTGITEFYQAERQLKPRLPSDILEIFPPVLLVTQQGDNSALPGDELTYTITAVNHTADPMTNVQIITAVPDGDGQLVAINDDGQQDGNVITWTIAELPGSGGRASVSYTVQVNDDAIEPVVAAGATAVADQWSDPASAAPFITFVGEGGVPIWAVQGFGNKSPYVGSEATTQGIVTATFLDLDGFWIQELDSDADPATSAGLFVLFDQPTFPVQVGDAVQITGLVRELSGQTTLTPTSRDQIVVLSSGNALPAPQVYDPPQDQAEALAYNESLEGMLVAVNDTAVAVGPSTRYGEYTVVYEKWGVDQVRRTDPVGYTIYVDDGSTVAHDDQTTLPYAVQRGDRVSGLVGPLAFTFGNYKIEPTTLPVVETAVVELPTFPAASPNELSVATFNVENLFDFRDPHPSSPAPPLPGEYRQRLAEIADAIVAMGAPTVIGLQEVENLEVLQEIAAEAVLAEFGYEAYLIEGFDSRGIDVGYLVRSDRATVDLVSTEGAPETLFARPPLLLQVTLFVDGDDPTIYFLNNHFLSLSAGEAATEPIRTAQAQWNADVINALRAQDLDAYFVVLGDLNSFYQTLPLDTLAAAADLRHVYEWLSAEERPYTYNFEGRTQTLDHILVSPALFARLERVQALHINADFPLPDPADLSFRHISDHDPLLALFSFGE